MCNFFSGIYQRDESILADPALTDSHADLITIHNLKDEDLFLRSWIKFEYTPDPEKNISDLDSWTLTVDETSTPDWVDLEKLREKCKAIVSRMIVTDSRKLLLGGCWIICGEAKVEEAKSCKVISVCDSASIGSVWDSSSIRSVRGSASIGSVLDSASIWSVSGSASIRSVYGSASIGAVCGSASIESVYGSASIG